MTGLLIWWTNPQDCQLIKALSLDASRRNLAWSEDDGPPGWPFYIADEYAGRYGRSGRGRLWWAAELGARGAITPWPTTAVADRLGADYAGIVIRAGDRHHVASLPGIVTDFALQLCR